MKTDVISIDNMGNGFSEALKLTEKTAECNGLSHSEGVHLRLLTEEMLSLARSITGEMEASFWIENEGMNYELHMTTQTVMDLEKRAMLIESSSSRKNDAAKTVLGVLRDVVEYMMTPPLIPTYESTFLLSESPYGVYKEPVIWDGYERSILLKVADDVRVGIRGNLVDVTVIKKFGSN